MGRGDDAWKDTSVRGDEITWLNNEKREALKDSAPTMYELLFKIESMRKELNETCEFDSHHMQSQLACYPGNGTHYAKYLDAYVGGTTRRVTILYYLNFDWKPENGGCLRVHNVDGTTRDVEPIGDRLVLFQSPRVWHEVMPAYAHRFAIGTWFY
eukprot:TRINITY_DN9130_c0_g1_i2.p1 TRINITY_DN9130_c0_g1~~TRINITY_DN9130_c0_g1_i2.p1  ORF type:complete len:155 (+),score=31.03 TRINITY_DN9130_c0_g1_i2:375-839(+)